MVKELMYYLAWIPAVNKGYSRSVIIGTLSSQDGNAREDFN